MKQADPQTALRFARDAALEIFPEYFEGDETGKKKFPQPEILPFIFRFGSTILIQMCMNARDGEGHVRESKESIERESWEDELVYIHDTAWDGDKEFIDSLWKQYTEGQPKFPSDKQIAAIRRIHEKYIKAENTAVGEDK